MNESSGGVKRTSVSRLISFGHMSPSVIRRRTSLELGGSLYVPQTLRVSEDKNQNKWTLPNTSTKEVSSNLHLVDKTVGTNDKTIVSVRILITHFRKRLEDRRTYTSRNTLETTEKANGFATT